MYLVQTSTSRRIFIPYFEHNNHGCAKEFITMKVYFNPVFLEFSGSRKGSNASPSACKYFGS